MKKIIIMILCLILVVLLIGCTRPYVPDGPDGECAKEGEMSSTEMGDFEDRECCSGLTGVNACGLGEDETCENYRMMVGCSGVCVACGNGVCDENENRCNCPEDCDTNEPNIPPFYSIEGLGMLEIKFTEDVDQKAILDSISKSEFKDCKTSFQKGYEAHSLPYLYINLKLEDVEDFLQKREAIENKANIRFNGLYVPGCDLDRCYDQEIFSRLNTYVVFFEIKDTQMETRIQRTNEVTSILNEYGYDSKEIIFLNVKCWPETEVLVSEEDADSFFREMYGFVRIFFDYPV